MKLLLGQILDKKSTLTSSAKNNVVNVADSPWIFANYNNNGNYKKNHCYHERILNTNHLWL